MRKQNTTHPVTHSPQISTGATFQPQALALSVGIAIRAGIIRTCFATALLHSASVSAETITIGSNCSLIEAIIAANDDAAVGGCRAGKGKDILVLPAQQLVFSGAYENGNALPNISSDIVIDGQNTILKRDERSDNFRFFSVDHSAKLTLNNVTLTGGKQGPGGAVFVQYGGALRIQDSILTENTSLGGKGGAIEARGDVTITRSVISHNTSGFSGGGIHMTEGSLTLDRSTVSNNSTEGVEGGAGVTIQGHAESTIINSTVSGNVAISGSGGGIRTQTSYPGEVSIISTTIADNKARDTGAGIKHSGHLHLSHSIVSGNQSKTAPEISASGYIAANAYNLFGHSGNSGLSGITLYGADIVPKQAFKKILGPLSDNGGKTPTHGLVSGSPAINAGGVGFPLPNADQRGVPRPQGKRVDIGSVEAVNVLQTSELDADNSILVDGSNCTLRDAITAAITDQLTGGCRSGSGSEDTIVLQPATEYQISNALPNIPSRHYSEGGHYIIVEGNGSTITAIPDQAPQRFFNMNGIAAPDYLTPTLHLKNLTLSGARDDAISVNNGQIKLTNATIIDSGVGVTVNQDADLFVNSSTIANNKVTGIVANSNALVVIANSTISGNGWPGLIIGSLVKLKMTDSTVSANGGRGILLNSRHQYPEMKRNLIAGNGQKLGKNKNREIKQNQNALPWKGGFNLIGYAGISGSSGSILAETDSVPQVAIDEILKPLGHYGGLTKTHALASASPAIDIAGLDCAAFDQRGQHRPQMSGCDAGSFEVSE